MMQAETARCSLVLPWPPALNHLYRHVGPKVLISKAGRAYREAVGYECLAQRARVIEGRLLVCIVANPPDRRRRDLDGLLKISLDCLQPHVYADDSQIDRIIISRGDVVKGGRLVITVARLD